MSVFLSHASLDYPTADEIRDRLRELGIESFLSELDIVVGTAWPTDILEKVQACEALVVVVTPRSVSSSWVSAECGIALAAGKKVFPLCKLVDPNDLPDIIKSTNLQIRSIETSQDVESAVRNVARQLNVDPTDYRLTWDDLDAILSSFCDDLSRREDHAFVPDILVGTGKRGAICGALLAKKLRMRLKVVEIIERHDDRCILDMSALSGDKKAIEDRRVLVVEYIRFTGSVVKKVRKRLKKLGAREVKCLAIKHLKTASEPDYHGGGVEREPMGPWDRT